MIVVAKFDRLFLADPAETIVEHDRMGIGLVATTEGFEMTSLRDARLLASLQYYHGSAIRHSTPQANSTGRSSSRQNIDIRNTERSHVLL